MDNITKKYITPVCVPYKVELADIKLENLLSRLQNLLNQLRTGDYYLMDITQDSAGIFDKLEIGTYLTNNFGFCYQGEYKPYYIVINQLTNPGVNKDIGNHIIDFLICMDTRLKETLSFAIDKEHGNTQLEATIYNYSILNSSEETSRYNSLHDCLSLLEISKLDSTQAPKYSVSFAKMWKKLSDTLQNSCCLVFNNMPGIVDILGKQEHDQVDRDAIKPSKKYKGKRKYNKLCNLGFKF